MDWSCETEPEFVLSVPEPEASRKREIPFAGIDCSLRSEVLLPWLSDGEPDLAGGVMLAETLEV